MFNPTTLIEAIIDRNDIPWDLGGKDLTDAVKKYDEAFSAHSEAIIATEDAAVAMAAAQYEWDAESVTHFEATGKLLPKDKVDLAVIAHTSAKRKEAQATLDKKKAFGDVYAVILADGFIDKWREACYPAIEKKQQRITKIADEVLTDVMETEMLLAFVGFLGVFPGQLPALNVSATPVKDLLAIANKKAWQKPVPEEYQEVRYYKEPEPDTRQDIWIVQNGETTEITAAQWDALENNVNVPNTARRATVSEIEKAKRKR